MRYEIELDLVLVVETNMKPPNDSIGFPKLYTVYPY
jgi:hypothetical protein